MSSLREQKYLIADAPQVKLYENYITYDRFMSYNRFNSYFKLYSYGDVFDTIQNEIDYYNKNYKQFLVLKLCIRFVDQIEDNIVLYDPKFQNLYYIGTPVPVHKATVLLEHNDLSDTTMPVVKIVTSKSQSCLAVEDGMWCEHEHSNFNGYCDQHQHIANELDDVDLDKLLTLDEVSRLSEFDFINYYMEKYDNPDEEDDEEEDEDRGGCCCDECYYENDFKDFDDRRHGPEYTIEDSDEEDKVEEVEELPLFSYEESVERAKKFIKNDEEVGATESQIIKFIGVARRLFDENDRQCGDKKNEQVLWLYKVFNTSTGHDYIKKHKKFAMNALNKAKEFKNASMFLNDPQLVHDLQEQLQKFLDDTSKLYQVYEEDEKKTVPSSENKYKFHMLTRSQRRLRGE
jgi:hypothetical protein